MGHIREEAEAQRGRGGSGREVSEQDRRGHDECGDSYRCEDGSRAEISHNRVKPPRSYSFAATRLFTEVFHRFRGHKAHISAPAAPASGQRSEEHTSELQSRFDL